MKFKKETPKHSGIYWYVDIEYPIPKVCWFNQGWSNVGDVMYELCSGHTTLRQSHYDRYRWGDEIVPPECKDNEVEN